MLLTRKHRHQRTVCDLLQHKIHQLFEITCVPMYVLVHVVTPLSVGPATSSPKDLHTGRVHPESLTPLPIQLDTNSSGLADQPDVNSTSKPRVGSARRQWNQSQVLYTAMVIAALSHV